MIAGRGVVFLHGAGARREIWQPRAAAFPQARAPAPPGRAGRAPPQTVADHVAALRPVLDAARVLVGHSLGGAIALQYALAAPAHLAGLILLGTGARLDTAQVWLRRLDAGGDALADFAEQSFAPGAGGRLTRKSLAMLRALDPAVARADFAAGAGFGVRGPVGCGGGCWRLPQRGRRGDRAAGDLGQRRLRSARRRSPGDAADGTPGRIPRRGRGRASRLS